MTHKHKSIFSREQRFELQLNREEEHLEAWRRDTHETLIKCLAEVKLPKDKYAEIFYDACNSALTGAIRAGDFRLNKLSPAPEKDKIEWAKKLTWKDIVEEIIVQFKDDIVDSITEMTTPDEDDEDDDEDDEDDEEYPEEYPDDYEDMDGVDERSCFLGLMRKLSVMYSIVVENERKKKAKVVKK